MEFKLILAIITITLALVFYTVGVFSERKAKILKPVHVVFFFWDLYVILRERLLCLLLQKQTAAASVFMA